MTLDEAIKHAEEVAEEKDNLINKTFATFGEDRLLFKEEENECKKCADEHRQLAEWLKDYKRLLEQQPSDDCVSREEVRKIAKEMYLEVSNMDLDIHTISDCISYTSSKCRQVLEDKLQALRPVIPTISSSDDCVSK